MGRPCPLKPVVTAAFDPSGGSRFPWKSLTPRICTVTGPAFTAEDSEPISGVDGGGPAHEAARNTNKNGVAQFLMAESLSQLFRPGPRQPCVFMTSLRPAGRIFPPPSTGWR